MDKNEIIDLLISSVHSDGKAQAILAQKINDKEIFSTILEIVETSESGDARMEGAYWLSRSDIDIIKLYEDRLLLLMNCDWNSVTVHIMIALSRVKSQKALDIIIHERIKPHLPWEAAALDNYL